jgi:hypothetical protein
VPICNSWLNAVAPKNRQTNVMYTSFFIKFNWLVKGMKNLDDDRRGLKA